MMDSQAEEPLLQQQRSPVPKDRFNLVYLIFYLLGLGSLSPWNFFITASEYFKYKLRNTTLDDSEYLDPGKETNLQASFEGYLTVASTIPNLLFNFITALMISRITLRSRMLMSLILIIVMFAFTVSLVKVNTDKWQTDFFIITMVTAAFINTGSSILCTSIFGLAGLFPSRYMQAAMTGQAMGGIFSAVANILTLYLGSHVVDSGLGFFLAATMVGVITLLGFGCLYLLDYSKYFISGQGTSLQKINTDDDVDVVDYVSDEEIQTTSHNGCAFYLNILKMIWREGLSVCLVFFVTLSCFPAISSSIVSMDKGSGEWSEKYFSAFVCFLLFNSGDWSGRSIAGSVQYPRFGRSTLLLVLSVCRVVFIPLLMLCNAQPRQEAVLFASDIYPVVFIVLLGLTNGYFSTLSMMYGPMRVTPDLAESTGAMMSTFLTTGLVTGSLFAILLMKFL